MNEFTDEVWKPVIYKGIDYTGRFEVSNHGKIRTLYYKTPRIQKLSVGANGYYECSFPRPDGKRNYTTVHRIVMIAFNPVPDMDKLEVNHKDECKLNNNLDNLEWCTAAYNSRYGSRPRRIGERVRHPVLCVETRELFKNQGDAAKYAETDQETMTVHLQGKQHHIKGKHYVKTEKYFSKDHDLSEADIDYIVEEETKVIASTKLRSQCKILCVETGVIYDSQMQASRETGILQPLISGALRGLTRKAGGYTWKKI